MQRPYWLFLALADNNLSQIVSNNNDLLLPLSYTQEVTSKNSGAVVSDINLLLPNDNCEEPPICPLEKETPNSTTLSKKIAQGNLTASCKRLISWFLLYKGTELGLKIVPVRPPKF
ncbi:hypothetical protein TNCV_649381 [Trichonephila clavipes]|nr:hypothetical protein TNCV_649381 [Trichonephila clavipes]